ncbi:MAG: hypothetical protein AB8G95_11450 [Anaerolineae bacterium]
MTSNNRLDNPVSSPANGRSSLISGKIVWISAVSVSVILIGLFALIIWLAFSYPDRIEAMRDVFIMLFALVSCAAVVVMVMMLIAMIRLINMIDYELRPILERTNETIGMLQGTTSFVSKNVVQPAIKTRSFMVGIRKGARTLFGDRRKNLPK